MDTSAIAFWKITRKAAALVLPALALVLSLAGCDTFTSSDSNTVKLPSNIAAPTTASSDQPAAPVNPPPEKVTQTVEPAPIVAGQPRAPEPKPAPAPATPPKGGERLVALAAAPVQPHVSEPPAGPKPAPSKPSAQSPPPSATQVTAPSTAATSEPSQGLYFKGPPRPPIPPSHKWLWLVFGLMLCGSASGVVVWLRLNPRPKTVKIAAEPKEEICLPGELEVKESTLSFPDEDPVAADTKLQSVTEGAVEVTRA